ncbi:unnamed protein product [Caenorhabditis bovis]|uniref:Uncharacterized protein n=1 Tax=Caenorhabditis bovis TaxID=2654633 RepID=A0A8S1EF31_9PELO|nr:unnamed protein product [Caenorhabditis bovis]
MTKVELYLIIYNNLLRYDIEPRGELPTIMKLLPLNVTKAAPSVLRDEIADSPRLPPRMYGFISNSFCITSTEIVQRC